jgi:CBS domain-containing protein
MDVSSCMKRRVVTATESTTIAQAAEQMVSSHVGLLPVVDASGIPIGAVGLRDLMSLELPDFVNLIADVDFVHDFGAVETTRPSPEALSQSIRTIMKPVISVDEQCGLLRAYSLMLQRNLLDLLVVAKSGELVGLVSRVDIGTSVLSRWFSQEESP